MSGNGSNHGAALLDAIWESDFLEHFFYFPEVRGAETAAERLRTKGWTARVSWIKDDKEWLVLATDPAPNDEVLEALYYQLEALAEELGGKYDGWGGPA